MSATQVAAKSDIVMHMKPSLDNPYARVRRAEQHFASLRKEIETFTGLISIPNGATGIFEDTSLIELPLMMSILIGEHIYNLRSSLDYLVYELAWKDSGVIQRNTQFPIFKRDNDWKKKYRTLLRGVCGDCIEFIKLRQPAYGCTWTANLQSKSNPDKHEALTIVRANHNPLEVKAVSSTTRTEVAGVTVAFDDGQPVLPVLQVLQSEVTKTLDLFAPKF
jgi:hypothetical protein